MSYPLLISGQGIQPIMPHSYYFKYLKSVFGQGEDADDSVIILMTSNNDDSSNRALKKD